MKRVREAAPANVSFVDELADLLRVSNDSAYRRMRCETLLSIDEISMICEHFKVPFETGSQANAQSVKFNYFNLSNKEENFKKWLSGLRDNVKQIAGAKDGEILYAADDVPVWHHFTNDEFICFKIFYWMKSIVNEPKYADKKFDPSLVEKELVEIAKDLLAHYDRTISAEIWTEDTLNSTLKQIEYFWESGYFQDKEQALRMCDFVTEELDILQRKAERSSKLRQENESGTEDFKLYRSEVMIGNNSVLVTVGNNKVVYLSNNTFNMMSTTTPDFIEENEAWLKNLVRKSILISGVSEKQRNQFFRILHNKVQAMKNSIQ